MLTELHIKNFTIIDQLDLELHQGMTVVTGETGAGKSIIIDALELVLGARADSQAVRPHCERCEITAVFDIKLIARAQQWLNQHELDNDNDCILRRTINHDGRSRNYLNGRPITLTQLREFGALLVTIHGQHQPQSLLKRDTQRQLLDEFAGHDNLLATIKTVYEQWRDLNDEYTTLTQQIKERTSRCEFLRYQVAELDELALAANEYDTLNQEHLQLANHDQVIAVCQQALQSAIDNDQQSLYAQLNDINQQLGSIININPQIATAHECFRNAAIQIEEASHELRNYIAGLDSDPERLSYVDQRLTKIHDMARKHQVTPEQLPELHSKLHTELTNLENSDERLASLQQQLQTLTKQYQQLGKQLTQSRTKASKRLAKQITASIEKLGMPGGNLTIKFEPIATDTLSPFGMERIEYHVRTNPGQPLQPLAKVVSGGELSRISLAIHVLTAQKEHASTLIFDEVDVGIGGSTAEIVGQMLKQLSNTAQVICITHLPQVAAQGSQHLRVSKHSKNKSTYTNIVALSTNEKINEIARMLGGINITDNTLAHAKEMLKLEPTDLETN